MVTTDVLLIVGEIIVDFTLPQNGAECKLRLGGVVHAARGLWASNVRYAVAAFCPRYLIAEAQRYLASHGCEEFIWLGEVLGAPNVIVIGDPREVSHQGYEDLLRDSKQIQLIEPFPNLDAYSKVLVFPGKYPLIELLGRLPLQAKFSLDVAYDVDDLSQFAAFKGRIQAIIISTSSSLFTAIGTESIDGLISEVQALSPEAFLLKENRGGSRLFTGQNGEIEEIPAVLGETINSVGVGDVYSAVMLGLSESGWVEAAWRGCQAATAYSRTTYPDDFKKDVERGFKLTLDTLRILGGTSLPWHERPRFAIYLAGPDFSYAHTPELDQAVASLEYHNFNVRRPVAENGELKFPAKMCELLRAYHCDRELLKECDAVFAVPLGRDPGTLVEVGMAIELNKPVITFDPRQENDNTMVMAGSAVYSTDLDACLNGVFQVLANLRATSP
jgi:nucleoside 2-deoxyribosyltransferase